MDKTNYVLHSSWALPASPEQVWQALVEEHAWTQWLPGVHLLFDEGARFAVQLKTLLKIPLTLELTEISREPLAHLALASTGDLVGRSDITLSKVAGGSQVDFTWAVRTHHRILNRLSRYGARRLCIASHSGLMRHAEKVVARELRAW